MLIAGETGSGKSSFLKEVAHYQWLKFNKGESNYIPILIDLSDVKNLSKCVEEYINDFNEEKFDLDLLKNYDESIHGEINYLILVSDNEDHASNQNVLYMNNFHKWDNKTKVIITCCKEYREDKGYLRMFKFKNEEEPLLEYRLAHVSSEQIKHLIE